MKKLAIIWSALFLVCFKSTDICAQNLIQNGSFELPGTTGNAGNGRERISAGSTELTGWIVSGMGDVFVLQTPFDGGPVYNPAQDGRYYLDLSGDGPPHATIYQDFSTTPGSQYSLKFYIGSAATATLPTISVQLNDIGTLLSTTLTPLAATSSLNWLEESFSFIPDSATTRLSFVDTSGSDDNASFVDNVSVTVVPEPIMMIPMGLIILAFRRRR